MTKEVQAVIQQVARLRKTLIAGEIYESLPDKIVNIMDQVHYKPRRTHVTYPEDDEVFIERLKRLNQRVKTDDHATISDDELDDLLIHIASPKGSIRDKGVFYLFNTLLRKNVLEGRQILWIKDRLLTEDYLFAHILEPENDAVFLRSFSAMFLAGLLFANRTHYHILTDAEIIDLELKVAAYTLIEVDTRGFVERKGWAHALTHVINVWSEINESAQVQRADKILLMVVVVSAYRYANLALAYGEDSHLANVLITLMRKNKLYIDYFLIVLKDWQSDLTRLVPQDNLVFWNQWYNRDRFMQSLLLQPELPGEIDRYLKKISDIF